MENNCMKKIGVYLIGRPNNGGSYQYWMAVLKALSQVDRSKYQVTVYSPYDDWKSIADKLGVNFQPIYQNLSMIQKIFIYSLARFMPRCMVRTFSALWDPFIRELKQDKPDLWIGQTTAIGEELLGIPTIIPIFDLMHRYHREIIELQEKYDEREKLYTYQCKHAAMILVDSEVGRQHVLECYGNVTEGLENKIRVLPFIPPDYIYEGQECQDFSHDIFDKYIFYPAQFWTHKNHKRLLKAIKLLENKDVIINLVLVGSEQNNKQTVVDLIHDLELENQVKILGYVDNSEMIYLYRHARALIMPTLLGPTNIPQLEAFELGCPVATSNIYGIPEQVGDAALLFNPENVDEIAESIEQLWEDDELCDELVEKGKIRAEKWGQKEFTDTLLTYICEMI